MGIKVMEIFIDMLNDFEVKVEIFEFLIELVV